MIYIFVMIFVISIILLIIGLVSPSLIIRWSERPNWWHVLGIFIPLLLLSYIAIALYPNNMLDQVKKSESKTVIVEKVLKKELKDKNDKEVVLPSKLVTDIEMTFIQDEELEELFFNKNYQSVINTLRKVLLIDEIILYKGKRFDYKTHKVLKFKTNTVYELTMKITNNRELQSIYILINNGKEVKDLKNIISSVICSMDSKNITLKECSVKRDILFKDIRSTKVNQLTLFNTKHILSIDEEKYYKSSPSL